MIEKVLNYFNEIQKDKCLHALVGLVIYSILNIFMKPFYSLFVIVILAILKEAYDSSHKNHTRDIKDIFATIIIPFILTTIYIIKG